MADRPPADVGLGDRGHRDGGLHPGGLAEPLEGVLQSQAVDDRGEHAHVVGLGAVHARAGAGHPPPDVAAADDDGDVDAELAADLDDLAGELLDHLAVDAVALVAGERLAGELEEDALVQRGSGRQAPIDHLGEADDRGVADGLLDRLLLVRDHLLLEQHLVRDTRR